MSEQFWDEFIKKGEDTLRLWDMSSISVGVVKDGETVFTHSFGKRDIENDLDADSDTMYQIASCSKAFTAAVCCALADQGLLDLDEPIRSYCPEIRFYDEYTTDNVTLRDLLSHRTGLPRHEFSWYYSSFDRRQMCENIAYLEPNEELRTKFQYCNHGYILAGYVCERVSGRTWEELVQELIFDPLSMNRSNVYVCDIEGDPNHGVPYARPAGGDGMSGLEVTDFYVSPVEDKEKGIGAPDGPDGSINSCVSDMLKWVQFNLDNGKAGGRQLISEKMMLQMHKPQMICVSPAVFPNEFSDFMSYGLGWFVEMYRSRKYVYHNGNINGFSCSCAFVPDLDLGIVVLTNTDSCLADRALIRTIVDHYLGADDYDWIKGYYDLLSAVKKAGSDYSVYTGPKILYTAPSHPIPDYAGVYSRDGYPEMKIEEENDVLYASFAGSRIPLEHYHYDVFTAAETVGLIEKGFPLFFGMNENGTCVSAVCAPLLGEPKTSTVRFCRQQKTEC